MQYRTIVSTPTNNEQIVILDDFQAFFQVGLQCKVLDSGDAGGYTVYYFLNDPNVAGFDPSVSGYFPVPGLDSQSGDKAVEFNIPCRGIFLYVYNSATVELKTVQAGPV